jgi:RNA polymerase sigma-70 factor (ECF subfamily)
MDSTIPCGKHLAAHADISGSEFHDVNLSEAVFDNVNLGHARLHNVNLSDTTVSAANLGGAVFRHIGPPLEKDGGQPRQRPVIFEEAMLCGSTFKRVDLSNVRIIDCNIQGLSIDGIPIAKLLKIYRLRML